MSAQTLLEQLLKSGLNMIQQSGGQVPGGTSLPSVRPPSGLPSQMPGQRPSVPMGGAMGGPGGSSGWGKFGAGTAVGGALGLLLGSKRGRSYGGKALKIGSVAALGALAYKAYTAYQQNQQAKHTTGAAYPAQPGQPAPAAPPTAWPSAGSPTRGPAAFGASAHGPLQTVDRVQAPEVEQHSIAMLKAMVAAAKADGHLDDRERGLVEAELQRLEADPATRRLIEDELRRPLDPADVARAATTPEMAAEMYLASLLVVDDTNTMERLYLNELARQLNLPDALRAELEAQAAAA
jgi:uncharacterized membrane protein YebE (DUF533 family)